MVSLNCRSIKNKIQSVLSYIEDNNTTIALFQETWLSDSDKSIFTQIKEYGFDIIKKGREDRRGGGVAILSNPNLSMKQFSLAPTFNTFEYVCGTFMLDSKIMIIVNLYRPPYNARNHPYTLQMFLEELENFISALSEYKGSLFLIGDFNINFSKNDTCTTSFRQILSNYNLLQLVDSSTTVYGSTIDLVIVEKDVAEYYMPKVSIQDSTDTLINSDHYAISFSLKTHFSSKNSCT